MIDAGFVFGCFVPLVLFWMLVSSAYLPTKIDSRLHLDSVKIISEPYGDYPLALESFLLQPFLSGDLTWTSLPFTKRTP